MRRTKWSEARESGCERVSGQHSAMGEVTVCVVTCGLVFSYPEYEAISLAHLKIKTAQPGLLPAWLNTRSLLTPHGQLTTHPELTADRSRFQRKQHLPGRRHIAPVE